MLTALVKLAEDANAKREIALLKEVAQTHKIGLMRSFDPARDGELSILLSMRRETTAATMLCDTALAEADFEQMAKP